MYTHIISVACQKSAALHKYSVRETRDIYIKSFQSLTSYNEMCTCVCVDALYSSQSRAIEPRLCAE